MSERDIAKWLRERATEEAKIPGNPLAHKSGLWEAASAIVSLEDRVRLLEGALRQATELLRQSRELHPSSTSHLGCDIDAFLAKSRRNIFDEIIEGLDALASEEKKEGPSESSEHSIQQGRRG